ncbi:hypothetical protein WH297_14255 [Ochrobactrum vermis]|uniref:Lipoprotein n=1 Tax=Ochrobactrum vermis TaxID=1827297 RepID=A0ABU8PF59_9HYPH|nr:hypothetical protein [Ochrobactrum vermis]
MKIYHLMLPAVFIVASTLAGCQSLDELDREAYQRACDNLDIPRSTPEYSQCMLQQQQMDNDNFQRSMDRQTEERLITKM